jgi:hypothetical protein
MRGLAFDVAHLLAGSLVLVSFMMLYQDRLYALLNIFALHAFVLALSVAWQAYIQDAPHLYLTALIALVFKAIVIPVRSIASSCGSASIARSRRWSASASRCWRRRPVALSIVIMLRVTAEARSARARGSRLRARRDAARPAADGDAAQRGQPGRRLHVAGERAGAGGDRRQGHAAGGRDQRSRSRS